MSYKIQKMKYQNTIIFIVILMLNLLFLLLINSIENSLNITYPTLIINEQEIMNNIFFYSLFLIIITPLIEEVLYRLPLIYNPLIIISFLIGFIYILILDLFLLKIMIGIYLIAIALTHYLKLSTTTLTIISILVFTASHIGNYKQSELLSMSLIELSFLFLPQFIVGMVTSYFRKKNNFLTALSYHSIYNGMIIAIAIF